MKTWIKKYKHGWVLSYMLIYFAWFFWLENRKHIPINLIHTALDDRIPFQEWFVIPYFMWFGYIAVVVMYFFFTSTEDYYKTCAFLFIGMTVCLMIYTLWPNGQDLRPRVFERDNVLVDWVKYIYSVDTSTNVCPSIHVFNSIGVHIAITQSERLKKKRGLRIASFALMLSICASTVFLKQHSVLDGLCAVVLVCVMYYIVYQVDYTKLRFNKKEQRRKRKVVY